MNGMKRFLWALAYVLVCSCTVPAQQADADRDAAAVRRPLLGVIRWDMFTGHPFTTQTQEFGFLKPEKYHWRAPFFVRRTGNPDAPLTFNPEYRREVYQEAMEQEIAFAAGAGIDYWAFGYERRGAPARRGLQDAIEAYLASPRKSRIRFCVIVSCSDVAKVQYYEPPSVRHTESEIDADWLKYVEDITALAKEATYQRVCGNRPLIYLYHPREIGQGRRREFAPPERVDRCLGLLRERLIASGAGNPYLAYMVEDSQPGWERLFDEKRVDCVTLYHQRHGGADLRYGTLWGYIKSHTLHGTFSRPDLKVIPPTMSGANWMPRYREGGEFPKWDWSEPANGEIKAHLHGAFDYVARNPDKCEAGTVVMYAWNEHSEGGFLCPTMGEAPDYRPVTRQLDEVAEALKCWKPPADRDVLPRPAGRQPRAPVHARPAGKDLRNLPAKP
jgi:hypothetical protein